MPPVVGIAWAIYGIVVAGLFVFSSGFTRYYQHKQESEAFATVVTVFALTLILATLALTPIDIFLVSSTVDGETGMKKKWADPDTIFWMTTTVQIVYYGCYGLIAFSSFFLIPFAYFYYEEDEGDDEALSRAQQRRQRAWGALKYTSFFIVICALLLLFGLFVKPSQRPPKLDLDWFEKLLTESNGEKSISFVVACLILLGMLVFIGYTAPGLSLLPMNMIKGRRRLEAENQDVDNRLAVNRERQRELQARYTGTSKAISARDQRELDNLDDEERILTRRLRTIQEDQSGLWQRLLKVIRPFEILIGFLLLALTWVVIASIFLTIVDKLTYSVCGKQCGYIISHPDLFNPVNVIFVKLAKYFPLDNVFMVLLIVYFFLATMSGVITLGVRFLWVALFRIRKGATMPQGLLFSTILLTLSLLALNYSLTAVVAPGYAHFGSQVYCNYTEGGQRDCTDHMDKIVPCDIYAPTEICTPTITSTLIDRIVVNTPFFGAIYYYSQWAFLVVFVLGFLVALFRRPRDNVDMESADVDAEQEDEEQRGLLDGRRRTTTTTMGASASGTSGNESNQGQQQQQQQQQYV
ncbi:LMBR1-like membrane protein-domain-containing protein [Zychaea mexicana]|uniref:LMBR1-like membrane protein-domain-containing protein n=1 Tax=Zychaea mexicana TaxID=64656 RepID=UPI0022FE079B|nr:LMBR1-like membrane protein-domain-containing protein [Zychaea mexicana]KAI9494203.1 LMBR1-like membrane protein-domain-containing protein [Zychaea mexicana]